MPSQLGRASTVYLLVAGLLVVTGAVASVAVSSLIPGHPEQSAAFQELVGGLGFGPAIEWGEDPSTFDPRICSGARGDLGPIPDGGIFSSEQPSSVFAYPPLAAGR